MLLFIFFFKQKTAYEMRISDWSSDVCSSDLRQFVQPRAEQHEGRGTGLVLGDVAQLDPLAAGGGGRIRLQRAFEPAVEDAGRYALRPGGAGFEGDADQVVQPLAGGGGDGHDRHAAYLRKAVGQRLLDARSEEHTSELQSLMRISYAVFCLKNKT